MHFKNLYLSLIMLTIIFYIGNTCYAKETMAYPGAYESDTKFYDVWKVSRVREGSQKCIVIETIFSQDMVFRIMFFKSGYPVYLFVISDPYNRYSSGQALLSLIFNNQAYSVLVNYEKIPNFVMAYLRNLPPMIDDLLQSNDYCGVQFVPEYPPVIINLHGFKQALQYAKRLKQKL